MKPSILIKNGIIVTPFTTIPKGEVLIRAGKIQCLSGGRIGPQEKGVRVIDARGALVAPGLIDVHTQGAGGCDVLDNSEKALRTIAGTLARNGTTSFLATTVITGRTAGHLGLVDAVMRKGTGGANLLGIHLEGPYINVRRRGMIRAENIRQPSAKDLEKILRLCKKRLAMMTLAPEVKGVLRIIPAITGKGIVASLGHSDASYEEARKGLKNGITHVTHVFNAMPSLHHRKPGPLSAVIEDKGCSLQLIADGVHIHPSVIRLLVRAVGIERIVLITDSMSSAGLPDGKYIYNNLVYASRRGAAKYHDGTLIGTSLSLLQMAKRFMKFTALGLNEAIRCASYNPASVLGIEDRKGSIAPGKDADIIIIDKNFMARKVIIGGEVIF